MIESNVVLIDKNAKETSQPKTTEQVLDELKDKANLVYDQLKKVDQEGLWENTKAGASWVVWFLQWAYTILEPFHFLFKTCLGLGLLAFGNQFHLVVIFIQCFCVTSLPIIMENWKFIVESQNKVVAIMESQLKKIKEYQPDKDALKKDIKEVESVKAKLNEQVKKKIMEKLQKSNGTEPDETSEISSMQNQMEKFDWLLAGAKMTGKSLTKIMAVVDPEKLQTILAALVLGIITCLVTLKNQVLSLLTQAIHIAQQIAGQVREYSRPLILSILEKNKEDISEQLDEEDRKRFYEKDGKFSPIAYKWLNLAIDLVFILIVIIVCWRVTWVLHVFASAQLGSTILGEEIQRQLRQNHKPEFSQMTLNYQKQFFLTVGLVLQIWFLTEIPILIQIFFLPFLWFESILEVYIMSPGI